MVQNMYPSPEIGAFLGRGWHCLGGTIGIEKQGEGRKMLRVDPAPPLIFSTASPGDSSCFPLGGDERVEEVTLRGFLLLPKSAKT